MLLQRDLFIVKNIKMNTEPPLFPAKYLFNSYQNQFHVFGELDKVKVKKKTFL